EPVADRRAVRAERGDEEVVGVHDRGDLPVDVAEDLVRVERRTNGVADLDQRREETRAALRDEPRADVEVPKKKQRDRGQQEPRLDEDDLDGDDGGESPEELRSPGPPDPTDRRFREALRAEHELQRDDLPEIENDERNG